jgi:hypothetical protein
MLQIPIAVKEITKTFETRSNGATEKTKEYTS